MTHTNNTSQTEKLKEHIFNSFKLKGVLSPLAGEVDINYKMVTEQGEAFVVKVYAPDRDLEFLNFSRKTFNSSRIKRTQF